MELSRNSLWDILPSMRMSGLKHLYFYRELAWHISHPSLTRCSDESRQLLNKSVTIDVLVPNYLHILDSLDSPPKSNSELTNLYLSNDQKSPKDGIASKQQYAAKVHRKSGQEAWLHLLQLPLQRSQQKQVLRLL